MMGISTVQIRVYHRKTMEEKVVEWCGKARK